MDSKGVTHVTGWMDQGGHETGDGALPYQGGTDVLYGRIGANGEVTHLSYLGGSNTEWAWNLAIHEPSEEEVCVVMVGPVLSMDVELTHPIISDFPGVYLGGMLLYYLCDKAAEPPECPPSSLSVVKELQSVSAGDDWAEHRFAISVKSSCEHSVVGTIRDAVPVPFYVQSVSGGCSIQGNTVVCGAFEVEANSSRTILVNTRSRCAGPLVRPRTATNVATLELPSGTLTSNEVELWIQHCDGQECGNGRTEPPEECDGQINCRRDCTLMDCGDGIRDPGESCDDGNNYAGDSCPPDCRIVCGNLRRDPAEECDFEGQQHGMCCDDCKLVLCEGAPCEGTPDECGDLVCGVHCSLVEEWNDQYYLCWTPYYQCMPISDANMGYLDNDGEHVYPESWTSESRTYEPPRRSGRRIDKCVAGDGWAFPWLHEGRCNVSQQQVIADAFCRSNDYDSASSYLWGPHLGSHKIYIYDKGASPNSGGWGDVNGGEAFTKIVCVR